MHGTHLLQCSNCGAEARVPAERASEPRRCAGCGAPLIASHCLPVEVTDATWDAEVLGADTPALVSVWSPRCEVCAAYEVSVRQMAGRLFGRARVYLLDAEENPQTAARYGVRGVPTVLLFRGRALLRSLPGPQGERGLREILGI